MDITSRLGHSVQKVELLYTFNFSYGKFTEMKPNQKNNVSMEKII